MPGVWFGKTCSDMPSNSCTCMCCKSYCRAHRNIKIKSWYLLRDNFDFNTLPDYNAALNLPGFYFCLGESEMCFKFALSHLRRHFRQSLIRTSYRRQHETSQENIQIEIWAVIVEVFCYFVCLLQLADFEGVPESCLKSRPLGKRTSA